MHPETGIQSVGHAIQPASAPVFLLSGIGAILAAMTSLFIGLLHFLREIFMATRALRIGPR